MTLTLRRACSLLAIIFVTLQTVSAQPVDGAKLYSPEAVQLEFDALDDAFMDADVVLVGETHNDSIGHLVELDLLDRFHRIRSQDGSNRVALSMEMFARDAQIVLDEYLSDYITESHFLKASEPWTNYEADYKPLVEFAKSNGLPVIAANAPRRYVNRITRIGADALKDLDPAAQPFVAPLPYAHASPAYKAKWDAQMEESMKEMGSASMDHGMMDNMLLAQSFWDATMAYSIVENLVRSPATPILHVVGSFHVSKQTGIIEHIRRYRPGTKVLTIVIEPAADISSLPVDAKDLGDFIILTQKEDEDE